MVARSTTVVCDYALPQGCLGLGCKSRQESGARSPDPSQVHLGFRCLGAQHDSSTFSRGRRQARQDVRRSVTRAYVAVDDNIGTIVGNVIPRTLNLVPHSAFNAPPESP